jgi:DNA-binding protein Fis
MDQTCTDAKRRQHTARKIVSERLRRFYAELKGTVEVDAEDFYRTVMQQAQSGQTRESSSHA